MPSLKAKVLSRSVLSTEDAIRSVTQEPTAFKESFINYITPKSMNNLVRSVNIHTCSAYCTKKGTKTCKVYLHLREQIKQSLRESLIKI